MLARIYFIDLKYVQKSYEKLMILSDLTHKFINIIENTYFLI